METQFFILSHMILFGICMTSLSAMAADEGYSAYELPFMALIYFIPLEIIYWVLHWWLV